LFYDTREDAGAPAIGEASIEPLHDLLIVKAETINKPAYLKWMLKEVDETKHSFKQRLMEMSSL
jgi:hypothetical protein